MSAYPPVARKSRSGAHDARATTEHTEICLSRAQETASSTVCRRQLVLGRYHYDGDPRRSRFALVVHTYTPSSQFQYLSPTLRFFARVLVFRCVFCCRIRYKLLQVACTVVRLNEYSSSTLICHTRTAFSSNICRIWMTSCPSSSISVGGR